MDTDSNTEKGKRSLIHHVLKPSAKKKIPDVGCEKNQHKSWKLRRENLHTKSKTDTDSITEKGKCSLQGFNIFTHY